MEADPARVATVEDLTRQLRRLFDQTGKSYQRLAADTDIAQATLYELVNKPGSFPERQTVLEFALACGQDPRPWLEAWARVERARPSGQDGRDWQAEAEELRRRLEQAQAQMEAARADQTAAAQRIQDLTERLATTDQELATTRAQLQSHRNGHAVAAALTKVGQPSFATSHTSGYQSGSVQNVMTRLRHAAENGPAAVANELAFCTFTHASATDRTGVSSRDVDAYLARLREAINEIL